MSSAAATSFTCTPGKLLNFTAVALNRSPYFSIFLGLALATTHLRAVSPRCQLIRGKLGVALHRRVRPWLVHAAFALVVSRILRGTCRSRATPSLYTRTRATRPRRVPVRLFVLGARSSAQRQEHSVAIVRTCRRARFGLQRLWSGAAI